MEQLNLFPAETTESSKLLFVNFGEKEALYCLPLINHLRVLGISAELYPDAAKMKKQMAYADARHIQYVILVGEDEMKTGNLTMKNMITGEQASVTFDELVRIINK
jgi:histidyl-tRNA synthetase